MNTAINVHNIVHALVCFALVSFNVGIIRYTQLIHNAHCMLSPQFISSPIFRAAPIYCFHNAIYVWLHVTVHTQLL